MEAEFQTPDEIFGELFRDVQLSRIFHDSKSFADCIPKRDPREILRKYSITRSQPTFSLFEFVVNHFDVPAQRATDFISDRTEPVEDHIEKLWSILSRSGDQFIKGSSLIPLPWPYIVPGGRFQEIYYWDSYFTQLGLAVSGRIDMIENMVRNFAFLIHRIGHIPNGNRTYFISRSQPPFFAFMIELLAGFEGNEVYQTFLPALEKEYAFWMDGQINCDYDSKAYRRIVRIEDGKFLNRYYDDNPVPRQESYTEDIHLAALTERPQEDLFLDLRAACESGWDFSSRWCLDPRDLTTIQTTHIVPVDLNVCLLKLEKTLFSAYRQNGQEIQANNLMTAIRNRQELLLRFCWNGEEGYFFDYNFVRKEQSPSIHTAGLFPLFVSMVDDAMASRCVAYARKHLLYAGGLSTTTMQTGQQWDAPNGWAPLQWIAYQSFTNYGFHREAEELAKRWINLNESTFAETGKLLEKYNVMDMDCEAGGGEYPVQDGFGWTNGVLLALLREHVM